MIFGIQVGRQFALLAGSDAKKTAYHNGQM